MPRLNLPNIVRLFVPLSRPHVGNEVFERHPSFADFYFASAVILIRPMIPIAASAFHVFPNAKTSKIALVKTLSVGTSKASREFAAQRRIGIAGANAERSKRYHPCCLSPEAQRVVVA